MRAPGIAAGGGRNYALRQIPSRVWGERSEQQIIHLRPLPRRNASLSSCESHTWPHGQHCREQRGPGDHGHGTGHFCWAAQPDLRVVGAFGPVKTAVRGR